MMIVQIGALSLAIFAVGLTAGVADEVPAREVVIKVNGMFCPFCTFGIEKRIKKLPETAEVHTDLAAGEVTVRLKPDAEFVEGNFADAVKRAGFTHSGIRMRSAKPGPREESIGSLGNAPPSQVASAGKVGWKHFKTIGRSGKAAGEFNQPMGIAFAPEGWFVVSDPGNARVQQFHPDGSPWRQWSVSGDGKAMLLNPVGVAISPQGDIWVSDYEADRINHYGPAGEPKGAFGKSGKSRGKFDGPSGIAITPDGLLAVADFYNHRVQLLHPDGSLVRSLGEQESDGLHYPTRITAAPDGSLWVADAYNYRVAVFNPNGELVRVLGSKGHGPGEFDVSAGIALLPGAKVAVADFMNHRIQIWTTQGMPVGDFGSQGNDTGQFERPLDTALSPDGQLYVVDWGNSRLQVFTEEEQSK